MSPIPSVATAFALSPAAPSVAPDPGSAGLPAFEVSHHPLETGGLLFAMVAVISIAGYFYRSRAVANNPGSTNTWATLTAFLSSMRHKGSATSSTAPATDWPVDLEVGFEHHVSMVYARFFHPMFWNLVECHPATPSAPAIYVEDEASEIQASDPKSPGMNSFLNMDDDNDDGDDGNKDSREKPCRGTMPKVQEVPPYDTSTPTNVNFSSEIIGATVRPGKFLSVPGEIADDESSSSDPDSELDFHCSPYDGISTTDSEPDFSCSPYDGIMTTPPRSPSTAGTRRYGMADMAYLGKGLEETTPEEGYPLVPTVSRRTGLVDLSKLVETGPILSCISAEQSQAVDDRTTVSDRDIGAQDGRDGLANGSSDTDGVAAPHEGSDLMRLLKELRDPNLDFSPRALSEDSDSDYSDEDEDLDGDEPRAPPWPVDNMRRNSLGSTSTLGTDSDVSDEGSIYPSTPPPNPAMSLASAPYVHNGPVLSPVTPWSNRRVLIMSPASSLSPPLFPEKAYVRTHRDSRSLLYGPRAPLASLPPL